MRRLLIWAPIALVTLAAALFGYFLYAPAPEAPRLSGKLSTGALTIGGVRRTYVLYVPRSLQKGASLVIAMHGAGMNGAHMRKATGYGFDRLADEHGFAVAYPDAYDGYWNGCNILGRHGKRDVNDVQFLTGLADKLVAEIGVDPDRVFAIGASRGGQMAFRLALEAPSRFRAVAAVTANVPTPDNFKCRQPDQGTSPILIMNGTKDPLNPFNGGKAQLLFGLYSAGTVRSSRESAEYFAELNRRSGSKAEVQLVAIQGGGHVMPQPYWRYPRLLGPTPSEPNGPAVIWAFFERQLHKQEKT